MAGTLTKKFKKLWPGDDKEKHRASSSLQIDKPTGKHTRIFLLYCDREYKQTNRLLNTTSHFLISDLVGHLEVFIKISLAPPMLKIDNFT